jgi:hypothetical protein
MASAAQAATRMASAEARVSQSLKMSKAGGMRRIIWLMLAVFASNLRDKSRPEDKLYPV